mmetsp:Transcript_9298/g.27597  ORF Transcript_9298/g.27597 Transcript_9298/m.27597 type:complete len:226 (+) Transcript_9298:295-972(+)
MAAARAQPGLQHGPPRVVCVAATAPRGPGGRARHLRHRRLWPSYGRRLRARRARGARPGCARVVLARKHAAWRGVRGAERVRHRRVQPLRRLWPFARARLARRARAVHGGPLRGGGALGARVHERGRALPYHAPEPCLLSLELGRSIPEHDHEDGQRCVQGGVLGHARGDRLRAGHARSLQGHGDGRGGRLRDGGRPRGTGGNGGRVPRQRGEELHGPGGDRDRG